LNIILKNASWSILTQITSFGILAITLPTLVKRLGIESFGRYTFTLLIWQTLYVLMDYSFNTFGIQYLTKNSSSRFTLGNIFTARLFTFGFSVIILLIVHLLYENNRFLSSFTPGVFYLLGYFLLNQQWYIYKQNFKSLPIINFISKSITLVGVVFLVSDIQSALTVQALSSMVGGVSSLATSKYFQGVIVDKLTAKKSVQILLDSSSAFLSNILGFTLANSPLYIGPFILSPYSFGIYAISDRLVRVFLAIYSSVSLVIFRQAVEIVGIEVVKLKPYINKMVITVPLTYTVVTITGIYSGVYVFPHLLNINSSVTLTILIYLILWSTLSVVNSIIGYIFLQALEKYRVYYLIMMASCILSIVAILLGGTMYGVVGMTVGVLTAEVAITAWAIFIFKTTEIR
jgi:polysaccharide transporter, PST family